MLLALFMAAAQQCRFLIVFVLQLEKLRPRTLHDFSYVLQLSTRLLLNRFIEASSALSDLELIKVYDVRF